MSEELKSGPAVTSAEPDSPEPSANGKLPEARDESWERFQQASARSFRSPTDCSVSWLSTIDNADPHRH